MLASPLHILCRVEGEHVKISGFYLVAAATLTRNDFYQEEDDIDYEKCDYASFLAVRSHADGDTILLRRLSIA
jgi:hypothetical protein